MTAPVVLEAYAALQTRREELHGELRDVETALAALQPLVLPSTKPPRALVVVRPQGPATDASAAPGAAPARATAVGPAKIAILPPAPRTPRATTARPVSLKPRPCRQCGTSVANANRYGKNPLCEACAGKAAALRR